MSKPDSTSPMGMTMPQLRDELVKEAGMNLIDVSVMSKQARIETVIEWRSRDMLDEEQFSAKYGDEWDMLAEFEAAVEEEAPDTVDEAVEAAKEWLEGVAPQRAEEMIGEWIDDNDDGSQLFVPVEGSKDYIFDGHYGVSPSGAERWMNCTASVGAIRKFLETLTPNQQGALASAGTAARQGTTAHAAAEAEARLMLGEIDEDTYGSLILELTLIPEAEVEAYSPEMAEWIAEYGEMIRTYATERGAANTLIEHRVSAVVPLMTVDEDGDPNYHQIIGSADHIELPTPEHSTVVVSDLKYGANVDVSVEANPQVRIYGIGVLGTIIDEEGNLPEYVTDITYNIVQPRLGGIKTWTEPIADLLAWRDEVLSPALTEALGGLKAGAKFAPSDATCQWCPVRGSCPAFIEYRTHAAADLFDVIQDTEHETGIEGAFPETESLSSDDLGKYMAQAKAITDLYPMLKEETQRRLHRGESVPGYILVNYTPPRHWVEDAEKLLDPDTIDEDIMDPQTAQIFWTRKMLSPTQALAAAKKDHIAESVIDQFIVAPDKRPVVAPEGDRRKPWSGKPPEQMFEIENGEDGEG